MEYVLDGAPNAEKIQKLATYLDDVAAGGDIVAKCWHNTKLALKHLVEAGLPISIHKCQFLEWQINLLGTILANAKIQQGKKAFRQLFCSKLPRNVQELQNLFCCELDLDSSIWVLP